MARSRRGQGTKRRRKSISMPLSFVNTLPSAPYHLTYQSGRPVRHPEANGRGPTALALGRESLQNHAHSGGWLAQSTDYRLVGLGSDEAERPEMVRLSELRQRSQLSVRVECSNCQRAILFPSVSLPSPTDFPAEIDPFPEVMAEATCPQCSAEYEVRVIGGGGDPRTWVFRRPLSPDSTCEQYEYRISLGVEPDGKSSSESTWE